MITIVLAVEHHGQRPSCGLESRGDDCELGGMWVPYGDCTVRAPGVECAKAPNDANCGLVLMQASLAAAQNLGNMSRLERHYHLLRQGFQSDADALASAHRFLWDGKLDDSGNSADTWEVRLAKKYYAKLYREYALADMSRYKEGAIGLRWRTAQEVFDGKGQFTCGNKVCTSCESLQSFELLFAYAEHGEHKQALVKLRVCPACEEKLNYRKRKEQRREERKQRHRSRDREEEEEEDAGEDMRKEHEERVRKAHKKKSRKSADRKHSKRRRHSCSRERDRQDSDTEEEEVTAAPPPAPPAHPRPLPSTHGGTAAATHADAAGSTRTSSDRTNASPADLPFEQDQEDSLFARYCKDLLQ